MSINLTEAEIPSIALHFSKPQDHPGPRVAEIILEHSPNLDFVTNDVGPAVTEAGKQLMVQKKAPGQLRIIVFASDNVNTLGSGRLTTLRFNRNGQGGEARVEISTDEPIFAPAEANNGLLVSDPLVF